MSKKQQDRRAQRRELEQARKVTTGKLLRLLLKSVAFAIAVSILVLVANLLGVPGFDRAWVQMALVLGAYLVAYPYLMREFRPAKKGSQPVEADGAPSRPAPAKREGTARGEE